MGQRCYTCGRSSLLNGPLLHYEGCDVQRPPVKSYGDNIFEVYHHDSPGVRVLVRRNMVQQLFRSRVFSAVGEEHLTVEEAFGHLSPMEAVREGKRVREAFDRVLASKKEIPA